MENCESENYMDISESESESEEIEEIKTLKNAVEIKNCLGKNFEVNKKYYSHFKTKKEGQCQIAGCNKEEFTRRCCIQHHEEMRILFNDISVQMCTRCGKAKSTFTYKICQCCRFSRADAVSRYEVQIESRSLQHKIIEIANFAMKKFKADSDCMIYIGKSSYDNVLQRRDCHIERFGLSEEDVDFYVFEIGDEAESYYSEHEILASLAVLVPKSKILDETPGEYGNKSADAEVPKFVNYLLVAKKCTHSFGKEHDLIDFSSWDSPFDMKEAAARGAFISADLSQFDLPKIKHHLTHRLLAKLLRYETLKDLQMK